MAWRVARSLDLLLAQINDAAPRRSKKSDGSIGDAAHARSKSDHNPNSRGVVTARDFTHDPAGGFDAHAFADRLLASRDPRIKYVISRGRIGSSYDASNGRAWTWRRYSGSNGHYHHTHVSVSGDYDNTARWSAVGGGTLDLGDRTLFLTDPQMNGADVADAAFRLGLIKDEDAETAYFGPKMDSALKEFQRANGLAVDGRLGPNTLKTLLAKSSAQPAPQPAPAAPTAEQDEHEIEDRALRLTSPVMSGDDVLDWQQRLWSSGAIGVGPHDGHFGKATEDATRRFQAYAGLKVDGVVGDDTRAAMARVPRFPSWRGNEPVALRRGARGDAVKAVQQRLRDRGWLNSKGQKLGVDGSYGPETERAVDKFSQEFRLPTGFVGSEQWVAMHAQEVK